MATRRQPIDELAFMLGEISSSLKALEKNHEDMVVQIERLNAAIKSPPQHPSCIMHAEQIDTLQAAVDNLSTAAAQSKRQQQITYGSVGSVSGFVAATLAIIGEYLWRKINGP